MNWPQIRPNPTKFDQFSIKFKDRFEFGPRSRIGSSRRVNRTAGIESKNRLKMIRIRIKYEFPADLDLIALAYCISIYFDLLFLSLSNNKAPTFLPRKEVVPTCRKCLQTFWYRKELFDHLLKGCPIENPTSETKTDDESR